MIESVQKQDKKDLKLQIPNFKQTTTKGPENAKTMIESEQD